MSELFYGKYPVLDPAEARAAIALHRTEEQWQAALNPAEYQVLREAGTERPFTGALLDEARPGKYLCRGCGAALFDATTKFDAGCGWPSFYEALDPAAVQLIKDESHGMRRVEVRCANCGGHLGHIVPDAPQTPTGDRYCMNSLSLTFQPDDGAA